MTNIWLEMEFIVVDQNNRPVNFIDGQETSKKIISVLEQKTPDMVKDGLIQQEFDACQIEIVNSTPQKLEEAIREIIHLYLEVEKVVNMLWYRLLDWWVPNQDFQPVCSLSKPYYKNIEESLNKYSQSARKATNIAWIHFHIDSDKEFKRFIIISNYIRNIILEKKFDSIFMSEARYLKMTEVVLSLIETWFIKVLNSFSENVLPYCFSSTEEVEEKVFHNQEIIRSYNLVWIKKPSKQFTVEVRVPDTVIWEQKIKNVIKNFWEQILSII